MRNKVLSLALVAVGFASTFAVAADSVNLEVSGTIVPTACTPTSNVGSVIEYGDILASSLNAIRPTTLNIMPVTLTMSCAGPVKAAWQVIDNRTGTARTDLIPIMPVGDLYYYGMGTAPDGTAIGGIQLLYGSSPTGDGISKDDIISRDEGQSWTANNESYINPGMLFSMAENLTAPDPGVYVTHTMSMYVSPQIGPTNDLPTMQTIPFEGNISFEIIYL